VIEVVSLEYLLVGFMGESDLQRKRALRFDPNNALSGW
jgi:hypothetical protein